MSLILKGVRVCKHCGFRLIPESNKSGDAYQQSANIREKTDRAVHGRAESNKPVQNKRWILISSLSVLLPTEATRNRFEMVLRLFEKVKLMTKRQIELASFVGFIIALLYIPTKFCGRSGICSSDEWMWIWDIDGGSSVDVVRTLIQVIVVGVLIFGIVRNLKDGFKL